MNIINYFKGAQWVPDDFEPDPLCAQVAELARGCAREGHIVLATMMPEEIYQRCSACPGTHELMPCRVPMRGKQICCLLCSSCVKKMGNERGHGEVVKGLRHYIYQGESPFEMAALFQHGQRIRIVWGWDLGMETLS